MAGLGPEGLRLLSVKELHGFQATRVPVHCPGSWAGDGLRL